MSDSAGNLFSKDENTPPCQDDLSRIRSPQSTNSPLERSQALTGKTLPQCPLEPLPDLNVTATENVVEQTQENGVTRVSASSVVEKMDTSSATIVSATGQSVAPRSAMETLMQAALERSRSIAAQPKIKTRAKRESSKPTAGAGVVILENGGDGDEQTSEVGSSSRKVTRKSRRKPKPPTEKELEVTPSVSKEPLAEVETNPPPAAVTHYESKKESEQLRAAIAASLESINCKTSTQPSECALVKPKSTPDQAIFPLFLKKQDRSTVADKPLPNHSTRNKQPPIIEKQKSVVVIPDTVMDDDDSPNPHSTQRAVPNQECVENRRPSSTEPPSMNFFAPRRPRLDVHVSAVHAMVNNAIAGKRTPWPTGDAMHNGHVRQLDEKNRRYHMDMKPHWDPNSIWNPNSLAGNFMRESTQGSSFLGIGMDNASRRGKGKEKGKQRAVQLDPKIKSRPPIVRVSATPADILRHLDQLYPGESGTNSNACSRLREQFLGKLSPDGGNTLHPNGPASSHTPVSVALTEKYHPTCAHDILGSRNSENAHALLGWLQKWSLATPRKRSGRKSAENPDDTTEKKRKVEPPKSRRRRIRKVSVSSLDDFIVDDDEFLESNSDSDAYSSSNEKRGDRRLSSTPSPLMIIAGPVGTGKTACVHAVAREAGYDVFELHPGMKRSAREVLALVGEVTQNHVMAGWKFEEEEGLEQGTVRSGRTIFSSCARQTAPEETDRGNGKGDESSTKKEIADGPKKRKKKTKCDTVQVEETTKSNPWAKMGIATSTSDVCRKKPKVEHGPPDGETSSIPVASVRSSEPASSTLSLTAPLFPKNVDTIAGVATTSLEPSASSKPDNGESAENFDVDGGLNADECEMINKALQRPVASSSRRPVLILLEEADILFEQDQTFWRAVLTLAERRRRPIVITCNDLDGLQDDLINDFVDSTLIFHRILSDELMPYLHLLSICEGVLPRTGELEDFCKLWKGDLRKALHDFAFWCRGSGTSVVDVDFKVVDLNDALSANLAVLPSNLNHETNIRQVGATTGDQTTDIRVALNFEFPTLPELLLGASPSAISMHCIEKELPVDRLVDLCRAGLQCWGIDADQILGDKWEQLAVDEANNDSIEMKNDQADIDLGTIEEQLAVDEANNNSENVDVGTMESVPLPAIVDDQRDFTETLDGINSVDAKNSLKQKHMQILDAMARQAETASFADGELGIRRWRQEQLYGTDSYSRCASEPLSGPVYLHKQPLCSSMTLRSCAADHRTLDTEILLRIEIMARREFDSCIVPGMDGRMVEDGISESVPKTTEQAARLLGNAIETIGGRLNILEEERELAWESLREFGVARGGFGCAADAESPPPQLLKAIGPLFSSACATRIGTSFGPDLLAYAGKIAQIDGENVRQSLTDPTRKRRGGRRQEARRYLAPYILPEFAAIVAKEVNFYSEQGEGDV